MQPQRFTIKFKNMSSENTSSDTKKYWLMFAVSLVACIAFLIIKPEWFWVTLPMLFTALVYALDVV